MPYLPTHHQPATGTTRGTHTFSRGSALARAAKPAAAPLATRRVLHLMALTVLGAAAATGASLAKAQGTQPAEMGRVLNTVPVIQQIAVPRQVCSNEQVVVPGQKSGAGAVMGGLAGGAIGNQIGDGGGRAVATLLGVVGGAVLGNRIEGDGAPQTQNVQRCTTQTVYENRTVGYNVTYEYAGKQYTVQMPQDPGQWVRLQVTPLPPGPAYDAPTYTPPATQYPAPSPFTPQPAYTTPQSWVTPDQPTVTYISPTVFTSSTTYVPNTVYVRPYPVVVPPPSASIRLNLSNQRGNDHWQHDRGDRREVVVVRNNDRNDRNDRNSRWDRDDRFDRGDRSNLSDRGVRRYGKDPSEFLP